MSPLAVPSVTAGCAECHRWLCRVSPLAVPSVTAGCAECHRWLCRVSPLAVPSVTASVTAGCAECHRRVSPRPCRVSPRLCRVSPRLCRVSPLAVPSVTAGCSCRQVSSGLTSCTASFGMFDVCRTIRQTDSQDHCSQPKFANAEGNCCSLLVSIWVRI